MRENVEVDPYEYEERCAIREFCGNMSRAEAERQTREEFKKKRTERSYWR